MFVRLVEKILSKECVALLICLLVAANSVQGTVLCFGADGHVEYESAFHEQCTCNSNSPFAHDNHSSEAEHGRKKHCHQGQCVDIPVDFGLVQISQAIEQFDRAFAVVDTDAGIAISHADFNEHFFVSTDFLTTSYFSPLRTIILLA
jgi:hypothetical protein